MKRFTIDYLECDGQWRRTSYTGPDTTTRELVAGFFGLDGPDVIDYKITEENI